MQVLEDFYVGQRFDLGQYCPSTEEIIAFARQYDPQPFHVEPDHPRTQALGGLLASGWHTTAIFMRLAVDAYLNDAAILVSPGVDAVKWLTPVRPGDCLSGEVVVEAVRASASKPDRGILQASGTLWNQTGAVVLSLNTTAFVLTRSGFQNSE